MVQQTQASLAQLRWSRLWTCHRRTPQRRGSLQMAQGAAEQRYTRAGTPIMERPAALPQTHAQQQKAQQGQQQRQQRLQPRTASHHLLLGLGLATPPLPMARVAAVQEPTMRVLRTPLLLPVWRLLLTM